ncbi:MAG TPA: dienelactone hydrolase family protein [Acetobacteraceae bacterium]|nr:dienelactone hydrolase family protein [Acetobacteraceae bacterium]
MRPFETLLILSATAAVVRSTVLAGFAWPSWSPVMPIAIAVLLALHLGFEGWREQMLTAYAVVAAWFVLELLPVPLPQGLAARLLGAGSGGVLLAIAAGLCFLRPVIQTPPPNGPFAVGTTEVALFPGAGRSSLMFRVWYPAERGTGTRVAPYATEARVALRRARLSRSQAMWDAVPAKLPSQFPVLLFFPAWGGIPSQNTVLLQDLASHGYFVAAPDAWDPAAYPGDAAAAADLTTPLVFDSDDAAAASMATGERNAPRQARLARHVLDRVAELDEADPAGRFRGRLNLEQTGMLGFSFGGSVAVQTALDDPRVRAVANLDGGVFTDAYLRGFPQPYFLLSEPPMTEGDLYSPDPTVRREAVPTLEDEGRLNDFMIRWGGMRAIISGMAHTNFTDAPLINDWRRVGGTINPARARALVDDFLVAFFDHNLRGTPSAVPAGARLTYPEVSLQVWPRMASASAVVETQKVSVCDPCLQ